MLPVKKLVALARFPLRLRLVRPVADAGHDRVACDIAHRLVLIDEPAVSPDHDTQLTFPVDLVRGNSGNHDRIAGMREGGACWLHEHIGKGLVALGRYSTTLCDVLGVVPRKEEH